MEACILAEGLSYSYLARIDKYRSWNPYFLILPVLLLAWVDFCLLLEN
jgi:hypothetical protein